MINNDDIIKTDIMEPFQRYENKKSETLNLSNSTNNFTLIPEIQTKQYRFVVNLSDQVVSSTFDSCAKVTTKLASRLDFSETVKLASRLDISETVKLASRFEISETVKLASSGLGITEAFKIVSPSLSISEAFKITSPVLGTTEAFKIASPRFDSYAKIFENFRSYFQDLLLESNNVTKEADEIFKKYKWLITPSFEPWLLAEIVKVYRNKSIRNTKKHHVISNLITNYFTENNYYMLTCIVESWNQNPLFKTRMKIIKDCLWALKNRSKAFNPSNLILPVLIAQIDGILSDYIKSKGWKYQIKPNTNGAKVGNWVDHTGTINDKFNSNLICLKKNGYLDYELMGIPVESPKNLIFNILFQKTLSQDDPNIRYTYIRSKILHGEYKRYGRIDNTIRVFLTLDFLANLD